MAEFVQEFVLPNPDFYADAKGKAESEINNLSENSTVDVAATGAQDGVSPTVIPEDVPMWAQFSTMSTSEPPNLTTNEQTN